MSSIVATSALAVTGLTPGAVVRRNSIGFSFMKAADARVGDGDLRVERGEHMPSCLGEAIRRAPRPRYASVRDRAVVCCDGQLALALVQVEAYDHHGWLASRSCTRCGW